MRRRDFCLGLVAAPALIRAASAQALTIRITKQYGLPYLALMVMETQRLVETHADRLGAGALKVEWPQLGGTQSLVDGILAGQLTMGVTGAPALITLWDKTAGTPQEIRALCAVQSMPFILVTRNQAVRSIADFGEKDRIALPAVKVSAQALALQMAAAQLWGMDRYDRLDPLTVTLPHPDAVAAVLSSSSEVNSHYSVAPFQYYELAAPGIRGVLKSYDTFGGKHTNGVLLVSKRFRDENGKATAAVLAALEDANAFIRANPRDAAQIYLTLSGDKRNPLDALAQMIADPDNDWTTVPANVMRMLEFMRAVGRVKRTAASWRDLFFPEVHGLAGS